MSINNLDPKYKVILDNLLDVSPKDSAIFCRIDNKNYFDFIKLFGEKAYEKVVFNNSFDFAILENNILEVINQIKDLNDSQNVIDVINQYGLELNEWVLGRLRQNVKYKEQIINNLKTNFQKQSYKWKLFANRAKEIYQESNIWPMHLAFGFVSVSLEGKSVYAPLFLKEVILEINNSRSFIRSIGETKINEKALFLLNNAKFSLNVDFDYQQMTINQIISKLNQDWSEIYNCNIEINQHFTNLVPDVINNSSLMFYGGIVLGLFQPSGGYTRSRMLEIIQKGELNKIINIEFNKNIYKQRIFNVLNNPKTSIFKITPTNFSQDKAIISSLNQNTIIWGPPGTGKSQTIVNILTNILIYGKKALVASQKKAALDVIYNRLSDLNIFALFMLNGKEMSKKEFYKPIAEYLDYLEHFESTKKLNALKLINDHDLLYINNIQKYLEDSDYELLISTLLASKQWHSLNVDQWKWLLDLPNIKYQKPLENQSIKEFKKDLLKLNNLTHKIFNKSRRQLLKNIHKIYEFLKHNDVDLNIIIENQKDLRIEHLNKLQELALFKPDWDANKISNIDEIKDFIANKIVQKINNSSNEFKEEYREFAATARIGSLAPYKFIKNYSNILKIIYPIIIATPETDLSAWDKEEFDYAILDESSQIFIEKGLPLLYLAKIKVLAGDDQQMKPSNWFGVRVIDDESLYGNVESLLDFARSYGVYAVLLDKNYRSNFASLMTFSSKFYYNNSLDVINSYSTKTNYSPIEVIECNGKWENNSNIKEAHLSIEVLKENINQYEKIILLSFNAKQQDYIHRLILQDHPELEEVLNTQKVLLRNIENIQGDEADLVIASLAYDAQTNVYATFVGRPGGMNALNVAISRAKDKMIVIKSIKSNDLIITTNNQDTLTFKKWLEFLELNDLQKQNYSQKNIKNEVISNNNSLEFFEKELTKLTINKSFLKIVKNYSLGTLNVDLALLNNDILEMCFMIDNYQYANNVEEFFNFRDQLNYIKNKKYDIFNLSKLNWSFIKNDISQKIQNLKLNDFKNELQIQTLSQEVLMLLDNDNLPEINIQNNSEFFKPLSYEALIEQEFYEETIETNI